MGNGALPHGPSYRAHPQLYRTRSADPHHLRRMTGVKQTYPAQRTFTVGDDPTATRSVLSRSGRQFALMPASLIIFPHTPSWTLMKSPSSSGVLENPSKPTFLNFAWASGLSMTRAARH